MMMVWNIQLKMVAKILINMICNNNYVEKYIEYIKDRQFNDKRYYVSNKKLNH